MSKSKRANGEGTITHRADGRWETRFKLSDGSRKCVYGATRREVQAKLTAALHAQQQGLPVVKNDRLTVGAFLTQWLDQVVKPTRRPRTSESYADMVRLHIAPELGRLSLAKLGPQPIQALLNAKLAAGLSPSTVKYIHAILHRALGQALRWGLVARNVADLVDPPRIERSEVATWDPAQARHFLDAIQGHRLEALYSVALAIGLRQGEALGLQWEDVDLEVGTVRVRHQLQHLGGTYQLVEPKTDKSRRTIALPSFAVDALRAHKVRQLEERLVAHDWEDWGLVFCSQRGTPLDAKNVTHRFQDLLKRLELPRMRFHDLRHVCASLLLAQGEHPRVVMEILGHSQIAMTMNTYSHVIPALQRQAADGMDKLIGRGRAVGE